MKTFSRFSYKNERNNVPLNHRVKKCFQLLDSYFATMDWLETKTPWFPTIFAHLTFIVFFFKFINFFKYHQN